MKVDIKLFRMNIMHMQSPRDLKWFFFLEGLTFGIVYIPVLLVLMLKQLISGIDFCLPDRGKSLSEHAHTSFTLSYS